MTRKKQALLLTVTLSFLYVNSVYSQLPPGFNSYVDSVQKIFSVPGLSIAVVQDGKVLLAKGYGLKKMGDTGRVNEHTLFPIASNTKAFTATALAMLVEEGKIKWDAPVINYLPWFRMSDPWVTAQITVRDLLVHSAGIPAYAGDILLFPPSTYTRRQILEKLKDIPLVKGFRTTYAYDNILYVAAGEVIEEVSGISWSEFIRTRILEKVGMNETISRFSSLNADMNIATAHVRLHNKVVADDQFLQQDIGDAGGPAGSIASNAVDMAVWMLTRLDSGRAPNNTRLLNADATTTLWNIVTPIPVTTVPAILKPAQADFYGYALGVRVLNYGPFKIISHGGKLDGAVSHVLLVPGLKLGITILTNQESSAAYMCIIYHLLDYYMHRPGYNWLGAYKQLLDTSLVQWQRDWDKAVIKPPATAPVPKVSSKYTGLYTDNFYGGLEITLNNGKLYIAFKQTPQLTGVVTPLQYETFKVTFNNPALKCDAYINFTLAADGEAESCKLAVIDPDSDIGFNGLLFVKQKNK